MLVETLTRVTESNLIQLHWLSVSSRIQYKLCMMMHDVYHSKAPGYLADLSVAAAVILDCVHPREVTLSSREPVFV